LRRGGRACAVPPRGRMGEGWVLSSSISGNFRRRHPSVAPYSKD